MNFKSIIIIVCQRNGLNVFYFIFKKENFAVTKIFLYYFKFLSCDSAHTDKSIFYNIFLKQPFADIGLAFFRKKPEAYLHTCGMYGANPVIFNTEV